MNLQQLGQEIIRLAKEIKTDGIRDLTIAETLELRRLLRMAAREKDEHDPTTCDDCVRGHQNICDRKAA
jgi:hypothetical protein